MALAGLASAILARLLRRDTRLTPTTVRRMHIMTPLDHSKTTRELGWAPRATPEAIADAAHFFHDQQKGRGIRRTSRKRYNVAP